MRRLVSAAVAAAIGLALVGCGEPGSEEAIDPSPPAVSSETSMVDFRLTSTAFQPGDAIPARYTCDGEDVSPALAWEGVPDGAGALVLVVDDPDARDFVHWTVLDLPSSTSGSLPAGLGASADDPGQGANDFGRPGWRGPCPPSGRHRYRFTLYALAAPLGLPGEPRGSEVRRALAVATVLGRATLEATYARS